MTTEQSTSTTDPFAEPQSRPINPKERRSLLIVLPAIIALLVGALVYFNTLRETPFEEVAPKEIQKLGLIAIESVANDGTQEVVVQRIADKKGQVFVGNWRTRFLSPDALVLFGMPKDSPESQNFFLMNLKGGSAKDISKLPGPVIDVLPSRDRSTLLLTGIKKETLKTPGKETPYHCLAKTTSNAFDPCLSVPYGIIKGAGKEKDVPYEAFWGGKNGNDLVVHTELQKTSRIFSLAKGETNAKEIASTDIVQPPKGDPLLNLSMSRTGFGGIVTITDETNKKTFWFPASGRMNILPLHPPYAIGVLDQTVWLIDAQKKKKAVFATLPTDKNHSITAYTPATL